LLLQEGQLCAQLLLDQLGVVLALCVRLRLTLRLGLGCCVLLLLLLLLELRVQLLLHEREQKPDCMLCVRGMGQDLDEWDSVSCCLGCDWITN